MTITAVSNLFSLESLSAPGKTAERLSLPMLQSRMKLDPEGYETELLHFYRHFKSTLHLFQQESALNPSSDPMLSKNLGDLAMFLAHMIPFYPLHLAEFPGLVSNILRTDARKLPSSLRCHLVQAIILLGNRKIVELEVSLDLFMDLQIIGDRSLRKLAFSHVVHSIRRMNEKHRNEAKNQKLQFILFKLLQGEEELRARRSLIVLCDLYQRKVWFDDLSANVICNACLHSSSRVMICALSFLLGYENNVDDSDASDSDDDETSLYPQAFISRKKTYKAHHMGTTSSKKKKKAKLNRVIRSIKKQQRHSEEKNGPNSYSPLFNMKDAQSFVEKLFSRWRECKERFKVKLMMLKVIARTIGLHGLILLDFFEHFPDIKSHTSETTTLLAAGIQACHDKVPPDVVEPLFKRIINQFVHDHSSPEAITVGLNAVREMCRRMPLLMNEDLLQDLALYKKSHNKAVSIAARSLITLFREICPSLLTKKDRGRPINPKAMPKAFGEVNVASEVPGTELLQHDEDLTTSCYDDGMDDAADTELSYSWPLEIDEATSELYKEVPGTELLQHDEDLTTSCYDDGMDDAADTELSYSRPLEIDEATSELYKEDETDDDEDSSKDDSRENNEFGNGNEDATDDNSDLDDAADLDTSDNIGSEDEDLAEFSDYYEMAEELKVRQTLLNEPDENDNNDNGDDECENSDFEKVEDVPKSKKRKLEYQVGGLNDVSVSLRALKRQAGVKTAKILNDEADGILSNEDFQHIKELKAKKETKQALSQCGFLKKNVNSKSANFRILSSEQLSAKRLDPDILEANIRIKLSKEQKMTLVRAGRADRGQYQARAAVKQKKTGGLSNRQKQHKKTMPLAAKRARAARSRLEKKQSRKHAGKQFRGRKAWK